MQTADLVAALSGVTAFISSKRGYLSLKIRPLFPKLRAAKIG